MKKVYTISFYDNPNRDGTLLSKEMDYSDPMPKKIRRFVDSCMAPNIYIATLNSDGTRVNVLKDEVDEHSTYSYDSDTDVRVTCQLSRFNPDTMTYVSSMQLSKESDQNSIEIFNIKVESDHGHLLNNELEDKRMPRHIARAVGLYIDSNISIATDISGHGHKFYILNHGIEKKITYNYDPETIVYITYNLNKFDPSTMTNLRPIYIPGDLS